MKTYTGSCHCGAVRFEADLDLSAGTGRCNCSYCAKVRNWSARTKPEQFRLVAGEDMLSDYTFGTNSAHHQFCKRCGVRTFSKGYIEQMGGAFVSVMLSCLDGVDPGELANAPVRYMNGRDNKWFDAPSETRHL
jgi:hypothetical protein